MSATVTAVVIVGLVLAFLLLLAVVSAWQRVQTVKFGGDPRLDSDAAAEAAARVAARKRHPSNGGTEENR